MNVRSPILAIALVALSLATAGAGHADTVMLDGLGVLSAPTTVTNQPFDLATCERMRALRSAPGLLEGGTLADGSRIVRWEFHRSGRFTEPGHESLDMRLLAERLRGRIDGWSFAGWRIPPVFDRDHHVLFWAYDVKDSDRRRTLSFAAFLTREGVLLFQRTSGDLGAFEREEARFRRLLSGVRIVDGQRWEDFRAGDALAEASLSELVANRGAPPTAAPDRERGRRKPLKRFPPPVSVPNTGTWVFSALGVLIGLRVLLLLARFLRGRRHDAEEIRMPTEDGSVSLPKPIEPEEPKRR